MADNGVVDRALERLVAVEWDDDDGAFEHRASRGRLTQEYLGRTARWAQALGEPVQYRWPFADLAKAVDPSKEVSPAQLEALARSARDVFHVVALQRAAESALYWAALGDLPKEQFPEFDDPYEPLLLLFERGGGFRIDNGFIELGYVSVPYRPLTHRAEQPPMAIDEATLDALDVARGDR
jgi:hypothetical protein